MADMMSMPLLENTLPMISGKAQFGNIDMGGMFTALKVRNNIASNNSDLGYYKHPKGTLAYELADNTDLLGTAEQASPVVATCYRITSESRKWIIKAWSIKNDNKVCNC